MKRVLYKIAKRQKGLPCDKNRWFSHELFGSFFLSVSDCRLLAIIASPYRLKPIDFSESRSRSWFR